MTRHVGRPWDTQDLLFGLLLVWVVKGEVGIFGEDLGTKVLISVGPRCPAVDDMEEENFEAEGVEQ